MSLAAAFQEIVDSLPDDWTDLELDLRIADETRYVDAAVFLVVANAQPYSKHDWHWRLLVAHRFGHAAAVPRPCTWRSGLLDDARIDGELALREVREGRVPVEPVGAGRSRCATSCARSTRSSEHAGEQRRPFARDPRARDDQLDAGRERALATRRLDVGEEGEHRRARRRPSAAIRASAVVGEVGDDRVGAATRG